VVEQVIQTATKVLDGGLAAREAVTILATLTREAVPAARRLRAADPDRAATYRELILALGQELRRRERTSDEPWHLRAVTDDLAPILDALG
jgi:IS4 transposase